MEARSLPFRQRPVVDWVRITSLATGESVMARMGWDVTTSIGQEAESSFLPGDKVRLDMPENYYVLKRK